MNTASFITKGLRFRPYRTLFLLLGFAVGVMVMTVLLSVGTAVLDQAMDEDLTGGGDIVILPAGIDVNVLKTGGVTAMNFDIPNARYLTREVLTPRRMPAVRNVSPELTRTYATLTHNGREQLVRIDGVLPRHFTSLWSAFPAALGSASAESPAGNASKDYEDPDFIPMLAKIDAFHTPQIDSVQTWAEWHYFNYHDDAGRSLYVSINALAFEGDIAASGYSRGMVLVQYVDVGLPPLVRRFTPMVELPTLGVARYTVAINLSGFFAVALLAGSLAEGLRSAGARLEYASHEIRDLRKFNEYVINSLLSGLVTTDADGRILTFNRAASVILGTSSAHAIRHDVVEVLQLPADARPRLASLHEGRTLKIDTQHRTGDGRSIDLGLTVSTLAFPDGRVGFLFTFQDVTDVRRLERDARLQQRLAAVGEMAAGIAHEIRNPLASMSGSIQVLRGELSLSDEQAQLMDIVLKESERLNDTIKSFLAYARPQRFALARLDIRKIVQDAALLLRNSAEVREHHSVAVDVPPDPVWCEADENQIRQILWNLATNGLRAMPDGGRLRLTGAIEPASEGVALTVEDEGIGIPAAELEGLFQPFNGRFAKGSGLGLAIVHRIVADYHGEIRVNSQEGVGTSVSVRLPARAAVTT